MTFIKTPLSFENKQEYYIHQSGIIRNRLLTYLEEYVNIQCKTTSCTEKYIDDSNKDIMHSNFFLVTKITKTSMAVDSLMSNEIFTFFEDIHVLIRSMLETYVLLKYINNPEKTKTHRYEFIKETLSNAKKTSSIRKSLKNRKNEYLISDKEDHLHFLYRYIENCTSPSLESLNSYYDNHSFSLYTKPNILKTHLHVVFIMSSVIDEICSNGFVFLEKHLEAGKILLSDAFQYQKDLISFLKDNELSEEYIDENNQLFEISNIQKRKLFLENITLINHLDYHLEEKIPKYS